MDLSIIISTRNRCDKIGDVLSSVITAAAATSVEWELFVMDNQSIDRTREVVESYRGAGIPNLYYHYKNSGGKTTSLNLGLRRAKGRIVAFLDDDVQVDPKWMVGLLNEYAADPSIVAVGGRVELLNPDDASLSVRSGQSRRTFTVESFDPGAIPVIGCNMSFARRIFEEVGMFDDLFGPGDPIPAAEDLDFLWSVCRRGYAIHYCPDLLVLHNHGRQSEQEKTESARGYIFGRGAFYAKYIVRFDLPIIKRALYETRYVLRSWWRRNDDWKTAITPAAYLRALVAGGCYWVWRSLTRPFRAGYPYDSPANQ